MAIDKKKVGKAVLSAVGEGAKITGKATGKAAWLTARTAKDVAGTAIIAGAKLANKGLEKVDTNARNIRERGQAKRDKEKAEKDAKKEFLKKAKEADKRLQRLMEANR